MSTPTSARITAAAAGPTPGISSVNGPPHRGVEDSAVVSCSHAAIPAVDTSGSFDAQIAAMGQWSPGTGERTYNICNAHVRAQRWREVSSPCVAFSVMPVPVPVGIALTAHPCDHKIQQVRKSASEELIEW